MKKLIFAFILAIGVMSCSNSTTNPASTNDSTAVDSVVDTTAVDTCNL